MEDPTKPLTEKWRLILDYVSEKDGIYGVKIRRFECAAELEHIEKEWIARNKTGHLTSLFAEVLKKYGKQ